MGWGGNVKYALSGQNQNNIKKGENQCQKQNTKEIADAANVQVLLPFTTMKKSTRANQKNATNKTTTPAPSRCFYYVFLLLNFMLARIGKK